MNLRSTLSVAIGALALTCAATPPARSQPAPSGTTTANSLTPLLLEERALLQQNGLAPIIVPRGERVGDMFEAATMVLLAGADDCFPKLKPRRSSALLPAVSGSSARGLEAALGVAAVAGGDVAIGEDRKFELSFRNVEAITASVVQLREALRRGVPECDSLRPFLTAVQEKSSRGGVTQSRTSHTQMDTKDPPLLIGTLFMARRVVRVSTSSQTGGNAQVSFGDDLLRKLGLGSSFKASVGGSKTDQGVAELVGEDVVPVAFSTAFRTVTTITLRTIGAASPKITGENTLVPSSLTKPKQETTGWLGLHPEDTGVITLPRRGIRSTDIVARSTESNFNVVIPLPSETTSVAINAPEATARDNLTPASAGTPLSTAPVPTHLSVVREFIEFSPNSEGFQAAARAALEDAFK